MEKKIEGEGIRRKGARVDALVFAKGNVLKVRHGAYRLGEKLDGNTMVRDVSHSGLFITSASKLTAGNVLNMGFYLPGQQKPINLKGRVIDDGSSK